MSTQVTFDLKYMQSHSISNSFAKQLEYLHSVVSSKENSVYIFHDNDSDGLCSFFLFKNSYPSISGGHFITKEVDILELALSSIPNSTTHILFLDTPSIDKEYLQKLTQKYHIIILDHHTIQREDIKLFEQLTTKSKKYTFRYINPLQFNEIDSRPITFFSYILSNKSIESLQLGLIGTVSDFYITSLFKEVEENLERLKPFFQSYSFEKLQEVITILNQYISKDPLYYLKHKEENAKLIHEFTYSSYIGTLKQFFDFIFKNTTQSHQSIQDIEKLSIYELLGEIHSAQIPICHDFQKYSQKYKKILQKSYKEHSSSSMQDRILIEHKGRTSYNRQLSEQALYELDVKVSCSTHQKYEREFISGSIRSISSINLHDILREIFSTFNDEVKWGGHTNASGFQFPYKYREEFIKKFREYKF